MAERGHAVLIHQPRPLSPFGEPARDAFFAGETVGEATRSGLERCGLEVHLAPDTETAKRLVASLKGRVLLLPDHIYLSEKAAKDGWRAARRAPLPAAFALSVNASVRWTAPLQDVRAKEETRLVHDILVVEGGSALPEAEPDPARWLRNISATPVEIPKRELVFPVRVPTIGAGEKAFWDYPMTSTVIVAVDAWVHVLWLNQLAFGVRWMEIARRHPVYLAWRAASALTIRLERLLDRLNWVEPGAEVHPSARLSGSIVRAGARVGPCATIKNAIIGAEADVGAHAVILGSVIGARSLVREDTVMVSSVSYPDATIANLKLQVSLLGRGSAISTWAGLIDARFAGPIKIQHRGDLQSTERSFLGSVLGHGARLDGKVLIQPGREIPNGVIVRMRPDEVVSHIPEDLVPGRPYVRDGGTLVPLGSEQRS